MAAIRPNVKLGQRGQEWREWMRRGSVIGVTVLIATGSALVAVIAVGVVARVLVELVRAGYLLFGMW